MAPTTNGWYLFRTDLEQMLFKAFYMYQLI